MSIYKWYQTISLFLFIIYVESNIFLYDNIYITIFFLFKNRLYLLYYNINLFKE